MTKSRFPGLLVLCLFYLFFPGKFYDSEPASAYSPHQCPYAEATRCEITWVCHRVPSTDLSKRGKAYRPEYCGFLWQICVFVLEWGFVISLLRKVKTPQNVTADISTLQLGWTTWPASVLWRSRVRREDVESTCSLFGFSFPGERQNEVNSSSKTLRFHVILWTSGSHKDRMNRQVFWCSKGPNNLVLDLVWIINSTEKLVFLCGRE